jgi:hypothetical protein
MQRRASRENTAVLWPEPTQSFGVPKWRGKATVAGRTYRLEGRQMPDADSDAGTILRLRFRLETSA